MTRDVLITISGTQMVDSDDSNIEMITTGNYYQKNGSHYVLYEEVLDDFQGIIKNTIKIREDGLDIIKKGATSVHMVFHKNRKNVSCYSTPFGEMMIGINTNQISIQESEDNLNVKIDYSLDINYEHISECNITVDVQSKANAQVHL